MWENDNDCAQIAELFFYYIPEAEDASKNNFSTVSEGTQILPKQDITKFRRKFSRTSIFSRIQS